MPVESTRRCKPALLRVYGIWTFKSRCRLHRVLKSGTDHVRPHNCSTDSTKPVVCLSAKPNKFLRVKQNWMAASENFGLRPRLPLPAANQAMRLSNQIDSEPWALRAALYCLQFVVLGWPHVASLRPAAQRFEYERLPAFLELLAGQLSGIKQVKFVRHSPGVVPCKPSSVSV